MNKFKRWCIHKLGGVIPIEQPMYNTCKWVIPQKFCVSTTVHEFTNFQQEETIKQRVATEIARGLMEEGYIKWETKRNTPDVNVNTLYATICVAKEK